MRQAIHRSVLAFIFIALPLAAGLLWAQGAPNRPAASASGLDLASIDHRVEPCNDFYAFACGAWIANNPIPADRPRWGRFDELSGAQQRRPAPDPRSRLYW